MWEPYCGWAKSTSHHFDTMVETIICWYLQGNEQKPGCLRWCRISFIHSMGCEGTASLFGCKGEPKGEPVVGCAEGAPCLVGLGCALKRTPARCF